MAQQLFVLDEILAMLQTIGAAKGTIENFRKQAVFAADHKSQREYDDVLVSSGYGHKSQRGFVELNINDQRVQMDVKKAREIGIMLIEAAEAAMSDEMTVRLLEEVGLDAEGHSRILLRLREIRQGTRDFVRPN